MFGSVRSADDAALTPYSYAGGMLDFSDLDSPDPLKRDRVPLSVSG